MGETGHRGTRAEVAAGHPNLRTEPEGCQVITGCTVGVAGRRPTSARRRVSHTAVQEQGAPPINLPSHRRPTKPWARRRPTPRRPTAQSGVPHTAHSTHPISSRVLPAAANHSPGIQAVPANQQRRPYRHHRFITMAAGSAWSNQGRAAMVALVTDRRLHLNRRTEGVAALTSVAGRATSRHPSTTRLIDRPPRRPIRASGPRNHPANHGTAVSHVATSPTPPPNQPIKSHHPALPAPPAQNSPPATRRHRRPRVLASASASGRNCTRWTPTCPTRSLRRVA